MKANGSHWVSHGLSNNDIELTDVRWNQHSGGPVPTEPGWCGMVDVLRPGLWSLQCESILAFAHVCEILATPMI